MKIEVIGPRTGKYTGDLLAAAPELLDALLLALPYVEDVLDNPEQLACFKSGVVQSHAKAIRAAIAKATGGGVMKYAVTVDARIQRTVIVEADNVGDAVVAANAEVSEQVGAYRAETQEVEEVQS